MYECKKCGSRTLEFDRELMEWRCLNGHRVVGVPFPADVAAMQRLERRRRKARHRTARAQFAFERRLYDERMERGRLRRQGVTA